MKTPHPLKRVCDLIPDGIVYQAVGPPDGPPTEFTYVSGGVEAVLGVTPEEVYDDPGALNRGVHPDDLPRLVALMAEAGRTGRPVDYRFRQYHRDGSLRYLLNRAQAAVGADGRMVSNGVVLDETPRVVAEQRLADKQARFRAFMDHSPAIGWLKDEAGRHVYISPRFEKVFGVGAADWVGKTAYELYPEEVAREFEANDRRVLATGRAEELVERVRDGAGNETLWHVYKFPVSDSSGKQYVGGTAVDITVRERQAAELRDRNAALERANADLRAALDRVRELEAGIVTMCAWTRTIRMDGRWVPVEEFLLDRLGVRVSHGISDTALERVKAEMAAGPTA